MTENTTETEVVDTDVENTTDAQVEQADEQVEQVDSEADETTEDEQDTFPREYVEKLRKENATYREKAKKAEVYAQELFNARVAATGRLADPTDLPFDEAALDDHDALVAAVDDLLARKPHLASRRVVGDVGQGVTGSGDTVNLAGILRSGAA